MALRNPSAQLVQLVRGMQPLLMAGRTPNLYWNAVNTDRLRSEPCYLPLPPVQDIALGGKETYRYVVASNAQLP